MKRLNNMFNCLNKLLLCRPIDYLIQCYVRTSFRSNEDNLSRLDKDLINI